MVWPCKPNASGKTSQTSFTCQANDGRRPVGRPRTRWTDYIKDLIWNRLGLHPSEMMEVLEYREVRRLNLELVPLTLMEKRAIKKEKQEERKKKNETRKKYHQKQINSQKQNNAYKKKINENCGIKMWRC